MVDNPNQPKSVRLNVTHGIIGLENFSRRAFKEAFHLNIILISLTNPLIYSVIQKQEKIIGLYDITKGTVRTRLKSSEKGTFLEISVLNDEGRSMGFVTYFGTRMAYLDDIKIVIRRKQSQCMSMILVSEGGISTFGEDALQLADVEYLPSFDRSRYEMSYHEGPEFTNVAGIGLVRNCCYQTARLEEIYCTCGRSVRQHLINYFKDQLQ